MQWELKGVTFEVEVEEAGTFFLASARAPRVGGFIRVRPFSSLGRTPEEALELLKRQIEFEFRKVPAASGAPRQLTVKNQ